MRKYTDISTQDPIDRPTWVDGIDNPYLHGPYTPVVSEVTAIDLKVNAGKVPDDLYGAYMRQGPTRFLNPRALITGSTATAWCTGCTSATVARATSASGPKLAHCMMRSSAVGWNCQASWVRTMSRA